MRPHGRARVSTRSPTAFAVCDRCGDWRNLIDLSWQMQWSGQRLYNTGILVCRRCYDVPAEFLRTPILPPDPPPVLNARTPNFTYEEAGPVQSTLIANVAQGAITLPLDSVSGFTVGNAVWIQLNNANFAEETIAAIDIGQNTLTIASPLPFSAPLNGTVTVANT